MQSTGEINHSCGLCHIELQDVKVKLDNETLLSDVSLHIHCGTTHFSGGCILTRLAQ